MAHLVFGADARLVAWVGERMGCVFDPGARAIGLEGDDGLRAVSVFERFTEGDCHIHIATTGTGFAMSRAFVVASFMFPFVQLRQRRLTGLVPAKNARALRFNLNLGFQIEGRMRETHPDDDTIIMGMLRRECRFLREADRI